MGWGLPQITQICVPCFEIKNRGSFRLAGFTTFGGRAWQQDCHFLTGSENTLTQIKNQGCQVFADRERVYEDMEYLERL